MLSSFFYYFIFLKFTLTSAAVINSAASHIANMTVDTDYDTQIKASPEELLIKYDPNWESNAYVAFTLETATKNVKFPQTVNLAIYGCGKPSKTVLKGVIQPDITRSAAQPDSAARTTEAANAPVVETTQSGNTPASVSTEVVFTLTGTLVGTAEPSTTSAGVTLPVGASPLAIDQSSTVVSGTGSSVTSAAVSAGTTLPGATQVDQTQTGAALTATIVSGVTTLSVQTTSGELTGKRRNLFAMA